MGYFLDILKRQPLQVVGIVFDHEETHKVRARVQLQGDGPINVCPRQSHQLFQGFRKLWGALVRGLEERHQRDVRRKVVRPIPAAQLTRFGPKALQLLQKRPGRTGIQDVLPWRTFVQRWIVDVGQQPIGGQLYTTISGRSQSLFTEKRSNGLFYFHFKLSGLQPPPAPLGGWGAAIDKHSRPMLRESHLKQYLQRS